MHTYMYGLTCVLECQVHDLMKFFKTDGATGEISHQELITLDFVLAQQSSDPIMSSHVLIQEFVRAMEREMASLQVALMCGDTDGHVSVVNMQTGWNSPGQSATPLT